MKLNRLALGNVSLVTTACSYGASAVDRYEETLHALRQCQHHAAFANVVVFTDDPAKFADIEGATTVPIASWNGNPRALSYYYVKEMPRHRHLFADFTMLVQWDGFIVNPTAWSDEFLSYDYIGAVWPDDVVGNDGFHIRSKRVWEELASAPIENTQDACHPCDACICRTHRSYFESRGIRFAPVPLAHRFSVEDRRYSGSFGFHGRITLAFIRELGLDSQ